MKWPWTKTKEVQRYNGPKNSPVMPESLVKIREYASAMIDRLTSDWNVMSSSANYEIYTATVMTRNRARDLERNNPWVWNALNYLETQIVGKGIVLNSQPMNTDGKVDTDAKKIIQEAWADWGKPENCEVTGKYSWHDIERLALRSRKRDGEFLIRVVIDGRYKYGFKLQLLETDTLDYELNMKLKNGNKIVMGVELDSMDKPLGYYLKSNAQQAVILDNTKPDVKHVRYSAKSIIHGFKTTRFGQVRGICEFASVMADLNMLDAYDEAETVAARIAAAMMYQIVPSPGQEFGGNLPDNGGVPEFDAQPGGVWNAQNGKIEVIDVKHPTTQQKDFRDGQLYKISTGMGISFDSLTNNYSNSNFSSSRLGKLTERDGFTQDQKLQTLLLSDPVFAIFLNRAFVVNALDNLSITNFKKFERKSWVPRSWPFVDPSKDISALKEQRKLGWISDEYAINIGPGGDINATYAEIKSNEDLADKFELSLGEDQIKETFTDQSKEEADEAADTLEEGRGFVEGMQYEISGQNFVYANGNLEQVKNATKS